MTHIQGSASLFLEKQGGLTLVATSLSAVSKIVKGINPRIRIGTQAKDELRESVEDYARRISELAITTAKNANRNTVLPQDIAAAREQLMMG